MRLLIIGAGAIGCMAAARFASAGHDVTLVARPATAADLRLQGLRLVEADGRVVSPQVEVIGSLAEAVEGGPPHDLAMVAVKAYDTGALAQEMARLRDWSTPVLSVQNGVGNEEVLAAAVQAPVLAGALTTPVEVLAPGQVRVARPSYRFAVAPWRGAGPAALAARLFQEAGFSAKVFDNGPALKWSKLLMNIVANAQPAILGYTPAQVFAQPALGNLEVLAWREALATMHAQGLAPLPLGGYPLPLIAPLVRHLPVEVVRPFMARFIVGGRGSKMPSLTYDLDPRPRGRSEVSWLNGAVAARARELGLAAPVNTTFAEVLLDLVEGRDQRQAWEDQPGRLLAAVAGKEILMP